MRVWIRSFREPRLALMMANLRRHVKLRHYRTTSGQPVPVGPIVKGFASRGRSSPNLTTTPRSTVGHVWRAGY
jgi:hypothetical protein